MRSLSTVLFLLIWPLFGYAAPLSQSTAFTLSLAQVDANTLTLNWTLKPGYFLYQKRIAVQHDQDTFVHIAPIAYPEPDIKINQQGELVPIYRSKLTIPISLLADKGGEFIIYVLYQGCSDEGYCYPPQTQGIKVSFNGDHAINQITKEVTPSKSIPILTNNNQELLSHNQADTALFNANPLWVMISFFGFGLLLAFTPCVLPMIPVLSSIIIGHGHAISTRKAFFLSLSYVLSMSITYGIIGATIAMLGANLQIMMQSPWVISTFSLIFVILALSMFDVYHFRLPLSWQTHLASITKSQAGGQYLGAALMGALSILILSPCVTPPLIGALAYIAETSNSLIGLLALFFLGLGMGTPLLVIGTSAGKLLPKAGVWMNTIKRIFGILMLGLALYLLSRLLSPMISMILWAALFIFAGVGFKPFSLQQMNRSVLGQVSATMLIIFGVLILYGAASGHTNPWQPLSARDSELFPKNHKVVTTLSQAKRAMTQALEANLPVVIDFYASWCDSCEYIEQHVLRSPEIQAEQQKMMLITVDLSNNNAQSQALLSYFKVIAPPTFLFYDASLKPMKTLRWVGMIDIDNLLSRIQLIQTSS